MAEQGSLEVADFWSGSAIALSGSTPFGYFDSDPQFQNDAPKICDFIAKKLGYPAQDVELTNEQMYADIEMAMLQYSTLLNEYKTKEDYFNLLGAPTGSSISDKIIYPNMNSVVRLSDQYAVESNVNSSVTVYSGSIQIKSGQQVYNLKDIYFDIEHQNEGEFTIRKIFHHATPPSSYFTDGSFLGEVAGNNAGIPHFNFGSGYSGYYTLLPMSYSIMRTQSIDMFREIKQSEYGFELQAGILRLFPRPQRDFKLWFTYTMDKEVNTGGSGDNIFNDEGVINDPSKINFNLRQWSEINKKDRTWIIKYSLALSKITLGLVRRKFRDYPYPSGTVSLDGGELVSEGISETEALNTDLKEYFDELSTERGMEKKRNINESMREIQNNVPLGIYKI